MKIGTVILNGEQELWLNISGIVGFAGQNRRDDVMLIQGFLNYIAKGLTPGAVGLGGMYKIPEITGEADADTYSAISEFQIRNASQLLTGGKFDGRIHPGSFNNRHINFRNGNRNMCISLLNIMATDAGVMQGQVDFIQGLAALNQELAFAVDRAVVNS